MKKAIKIASVALAALLSTGAVTDARAEGFAITEWSARGMSLANGLVARADDASAVAYNPAGITQIPGFTFMTGTAVSFPSGSVTTNVNGVWSKTNAKDEYWVIPHFYATYQLNDKFWLGLGIFPRYGLGNNFPNKWAGNRSLTYVAIHTATMNPNIAWKINDYVSVAAGLEITGGQLKLNQVYDIAPNFQNRSTLKGQGATVGANLALHVRFNEQWSAGLTYRSRMNLRVKGDVSWDRQLGALNPMMQNADLYGTLCTPDVFSLGVAYKPLPNLSFEADVFYSMWSNYRSLDIHFRSPISATLSQPKKWKDTWAFALSAEYLPVEWLALRAGYMLETSPINAKNADYLIPSNGRQYFTLGAGVLWDQWTVDLAYTYIKVRDLSFDTAAQYHPATVYPGKSKVTAHNVGVSVGYKF